MTITTTTRAGDRATVRPMADADLLEADQVLRGAFDTFVGVPDLFGDADYVHTRYRAAPEAAIVAELDGQLVGSNFAAAWGSFGFFGPLSVRPELWDQGLAQRLLDRTLQHLDGMGVAHTGLFTFAESTKHVALYQRYGFWPQRLTLVTAAPVVPVPADGGAIHLSDAAPAERAPLVDGCAAVADSILDGLDLGREIEAVASQDLGETIVLANDGVEGFAVCHRGAGSEAGSDTCYVKFAAVRGGREASTRFGRLLDACHAYAHGVGAHVVVAGVNTARHDACAQMLSRGFRAQVHGVAMQRGDDPGYNRPDVHVIDDWR